MLINISFSTVSEEAFFELNFILDRKAAKRIFSQFIVKINVLFFCTFAMFRWRKMLFKGSFFHQFSNGKTAKHEKKKVVNLCFLFAAFVYFHSSVFTLNSKVSLRSIILWRYLNVSSFNLFSFPTESLDFDFSSSTKGINDKVNKEFHSLQTISVLGAKQTVLSFFSCWDWLNLEFFCCKFCTVWWFEKKNNKTDERKETSIGKCCRMFKHI